MFDKDDIILEEATQAFFKVIATRYNLKTGDLEAYPDLVFRAACMAVIEAYREQNEE